MRKLWKIGLLIVLLGGLVGAYFYLSKNPVDNTKKNTNENSNTNTSSIVEILKLDEKKLTKIDLKNEKGGLSLIKKDGKWVSAEKPDVKLDESMLANVASNFTVLNAQKTIEKDPADLEKYGLKDVKNSATATLDDGSTYTLELGNEAPGGGSYYLKLKDKNEVYIVSSSVGEAIKYSLSDLRAKLLTTIDTTDLQYLKIVNTKGETIEIKINDTQNDQEKQYGLNGYIVTKPYESPRGVDSNNLTKLNTAIGELKIVDFVSDSAKDLEKYGLDKPTLELLAKDSKAELHLYFGKDLDDSKVAFKVAGSPEIYSIEKSSLKAIDVKPFDVVDKFVALVNIDTVNKITIEKGSQKDTITFSRTTKKAEKEGEKDETVTTYKLNDKEVEEDPFKDYYQSLIGLQVEALNDKKLEEKPEVRIVYDLNLANKKSTVVSLVSYSNDFYAAFVDGRSQFLISKFQVENMFKELDKIRK